MVTAPGRREVGPQGCNEVWSADFVFDRTAQGRVLKCLTIVDDATTEAVAIAPARALGGLPVTWIVNRLAIERGLPTAPRTDNGPEFCGRAMLTWAHERDVALRLIEPIKPNQNAYVESFNGQFRSWQRPGEDAKDRRVATDGARETGGVSVRWRSKAG